jgi:hypothetical protein
MTAPIWAMNGLSHPQSQMSRPRFTRHRIRRYGSSWPEICVHLLCHASAYRCIDTVRRKRRPAIRCCSKIKSNEESGVKKRTLVNTTPYYRLSWANPFDRDNLEHTFEAVVRGKCPPLFLPPPLTEIREAAQSKAALTHCARYTHTQAHIHGCRPRPTSTHVFSDIGYHVVTFLSALACSLGPKSSIAHNARQRDCHEKLTLSISVYLCLQPKLSTLAFGHETVGFSTEQV